MVDQPSNPPMNLQSFQGCHQGQACAARSITYVVMPSSATPGIQATLACTGQPSLVQSSAARTASAGVVAMAGPSSRSACMAASLQRAARSLPL